MEIILTYSQQTCKNDGRSYINTEGDKILLVSQNDYKTIEIIDVESQRCIWYMNIKGRTIHARPSIRFDTLLISYVLNSTNDNPDTLYIIECKWETSSLKTLFIKEQVEGIYSFSQRCISYCKNNNNYILTFDRNYNPIKETIVLGMPYDVYLVNSGIIYLKYSLVLGVPYVSLVYATSENVVNIPFGRNVICYMTVTTHPIKNITWVVITLNNSKISTQIKVFKIKDTIELKYTDDLSGMTNATYAYINDEGSKILLSGNRNKINIINVYDIEKDPRTYGLAIRKWTNKVYKTIQSVSNGYWIVNQSSNFINIILTNSNESKNNVIVMSEIDKD